MKHPHFEMLGDRYPSQLERQFDRILTKIEQLWDRPELHDYFSDLLIDKRGGRKGFPPEVLKELIALREFRELETFRKTEKVEEAIRELESRGINLTKGNFFRALYDGDQRVIDLFIRSTFNVNIVNENGDSALMVAMKKGFSIVAKILVLAGADVDAADKLGLTPILVACAQTGQGYKEIAELLIKRGAFIHVRDSLGNTPLILALSGGAVDIARLLIERDADIFACNKKGETALFLARKSKDPEAAGIVELLFRKGHPGP